jgi:hypothetical protein
MGLFSRKKNKTQERPQLVCPKELQQQLEDARRDNKDQDEGLIKDRLATVEVIKTTERARAAKDQNRFAEQIVMVFTPRKPQKGH